MKKAILHYNNLRSWTLGLVLLASTSLLAQEYRCITYGASCCQLAVRGPGTSGCICPGQHVKVSQDQPTPPPTYNYEPTSSGVPPAGEPAEDARQMAVYYKAAKNSYLKAASLTACPERAIVFRQYALWCDCQVARLNSDTPTPECGEGNFPIPDCEGDLVGAAPYNGTGTAASMALPYSNDPEVQDALNKLQDILQKALLNDGDDTDPEEDYASDPEVQDVINQMQNILQQSLDQSPSNGENPDSDNQIQDALDRQLNEMQRLLQNNQNPN